MLRCPLPESPVLRILALLASVSVAPVFSTVAQARSSVVVGDRIRVVIAQPAGTPLVGTVSAVTADSLLLQVEGTAAPLAIEKSTIMKIDVSKGRHGHTGKGAGIGLGLGVLGGGIAGAIDEAHCNGICFLNTDASVEAGAIVFGALGAVAGALIGTFARSERWRPATLTQ